MKYLTLLFSLLIGSVLVGCAANNEAAGRQPTIPLEACRLASGVAAQCGTVTVFENRDTQTGRTIDLNVAVLAATGSSNVVEPDPLFLLAGGPGQAAVEVYPNAAFLFEEVNRTRDIVLVDQRGTGDSNGFVCDNLTDDSLPDDLPDEAAVGLLDACRESLTAQADLTQYTTDRFIEDLEEVRVALDYDAINLYGASYGSRAALAYMRRFPDVIRSAVLDAVAGPDLVLFRDMPRDGQRALDLLFERCAGDEACHAAFPDLRTEYQDLLSQLEEPQPISVAHPLTNEPLEFRLTRDRLSQYVFNILYSAELQSLLPLLIHHAHETGDFAPLVIQALAVGESAGVYPGLLYALTCSEDEPLIGSDEARDVPADTSFGSFAANFQAICATWPRADVAADLRQPLQSDIPALLLSGGADPVTPPAYAETVAATLPNSRHLVVPGYGHGVLAVGCMPRVVAQFIREGNADTLDTDCLEELEPPPFFVDFAGPQP
ncbi:MAG: alpha/beta fold hydrolase [Anaerolineales bacterium]|uniref:alpha/beta hydrolase n=1 Tax=Promineifilum sp. TaxID=2664178 RepID=UPI001DEC1734|nr:alpha/beta fold hydrolase [Anaerolineales bacterium]MCB8933950.1 alpha/beta fold hydrolase [Promineifilum sp.]MCO5179351.1 alpha/beta hydrolase [Promineifilum sp.]